MSLDCHDHSCRFAENRTGQRTNGHCRCSLPDEGAIFSEDGTRRFWLGRRISNGIAIEGVAGKRLFLCGVQPSKAGHTENDPTILRELGFGERLGFLWLDKVNLFDRWSPDPSTLYTDVEPYLKINDQYILAAAARCDFHVCCWGNHGAHLARGARVKRLLLKRGHKLHIFGLTKDGYPIHPLARGKSRIPDDAQPMEWT